MIHRVTTAVLVLLCFVLIAPRAVWAQAEVVEEPWNPSLAGKVAFSQAGFRNWQEGGVNALALSTGLDGKLTRKSLYWAHTHELRLALGVVKQDEVDLRKAEDLIRLLFSLRYRGEGFFSRFSPTLAASLRTQFASGFNFKEDPFGGSRTPPVKVSAFFAPAQLLQSVGLTYAPNDWFKQRVSLAAKQTVVMIDRLRPLYGVALDKNARVEAGLESFTEIDREVFENVHYKTKLGLFAAFNQTDKPDLYWENTIAMKVNSWLSTNFEFVMIYDKDISTEVQLKEVFSVGIAFNLL